jgi:hypothetical protein
MFWHWLEWQMKTHKGLVFASDVNKLFNTTTAIFWYKNMYALVPRDDIS